ncbi:serine hydrolase domain-containing protein [Winogradskyella sp.]|uniref:serine hydrolase domain-containing protein n=1 Tax=Winogradskyella sp. TaxID=1883156 RepID=UPI003516D11E
MKKIKTIIFAVVATVCSALQSKAQVDKNSDLFKTLKKQDSIFFEKGFNQCDLEYLDNHIAEDLKFYHDQSGFQDRNSFFNNTKKYICSNPDVKPIRKVNASSLEAFPLFNNGKLYGAIQKGEHSFYIRENGKEDVLTSIAMFTHVWLLKGDDWVLSEALSYDHQDPSKSTVRINEIEQLLKDNHIPALGLGIIENGKLTKVEVYGTLDKNQKAPYNTIFKVASLTKPVFALTVLKLVDNGLLDMNEPLHKYWIDPDLKNDKRHKKLTPFLVLTHQTGFPNWRYMTDSNKLHFQFNPGEKYQYSGEGFEYLRKAVEKKLERSIEELAQEFLFKPAGMNDTRFWWDDFMDESRYAQNFDENGNNIETVKYYEANAAANLLTTVEDYGRFVAYVINGAELNQELFQEMKKHQVKLRENDFFGFGWEILTDFSDDEFAMLHTGKDPGVSTLAIMFPKSKNGYVVFLNGDNVNNIYEYLLTQKLYLGNELWDKR